MNKIEELERRVRALESLLEVNSEVILDENLSPFWNPSTSEKLWDGKPHKVVFRCIKDHYHDTVLEAKSYTEAK